MVAESTPDDLESDGFSDDSVIIRGVSKPRHIADDDVIGLDTTIADVDMVEDGPPSQPRRRAHGEQQVLLCY